MAIAACFFMWYLVKTGLEGPWDELVGSIGASWLVPEADRMPRPASSTTSTTRNTLQGAQRPCATHSTHLHPPSSATTRGLACERRGFLCARAATPANQCASIWAINLARAHLFGQLISIHIDDHHRGSPATAQIPKHTSSL